MPKKTTCVLMSILCLTPLASSMAAPDRPVPALGAPDDTPRLPLRLATQLNAAPDADELRRNLLRVEFRMLTMLEEQLAQNDIEFAPPPPAENRSIPPEAPSSPEAPSVSAVQATKPPTESAAPAPADATAGSWPLYGGAGFAALLAFLVARRRRLDKPRDAPPADVDEQTVLILSEPDGSGPQRISPPAAETEPATPPTFPTPPMEGASADSDAPSPSDDRAVIELARILTSFGRDNGAAQALLDHLERHPSEALQPWIRLLEIYRGNDMRPAFELLADHLNRSFNVELIRWDDAVTGPALELTPADMEKKRAMTLELYPHIRDQIDALWGKEECLDYLQQLLRNNREGQRNGFTFQVVQEILFLTELMAAQKAAVPAGHSVPPESSASAR